VVKPRIRKWAADVPNPWICKHGIIGSMGKSPTDAYYRWLDMWGRCVGH